MTDQHPITPPPELVEQWEAETAHTTKDETWHVAVQAARWGADQELEACCDWLDRNNQWARCDIDELHDARRPKPPSLKEQAHEALGRFFSNAHTQASQMTQDFEIIRRAVEQLYD